VNKAIEKPDAEAALVEAVAAYAMDPLGFAQFAWQWGEGELEGCALDPWQIKLLDEIGQALRSGVLTNFAEVVQYATASGHGIGKSAAVSMLINWAMSTGVDTRGVVTANTDTQLRTKTWPELGKWHRLCITAHWFEFTATSLYSREEGHEKTWRFDAIPWSDSNTEAWAGLHNKGKRIVVIFDEASAISDKIWEVAEGALTDEGTQIIWCVFGNPTRNTGRFVDCFNRLRHRWITQQVDSRTVAITNKVQLNKMVADHGEDSDIVRVRVRGVFPKVGERQFIGSDIVEAARTRHLREDEFSFAPVILTLDPAWYGGDELVIAMRQGLRSRILMSFHHAAGSDDSTVAGYLAKFEDEFKADAVFVDMGYGTGVVSAGKLMGRQWTLVSFGSKSGTEGYLNKRAEMWGKMRDWLKEGGSLENDPILCAELCAPEYTVKLSGEVVLESKDDLKKRGMQSPNRADALALTFAFPVLKRSINGTYVSVEPFHLHRYLDEQSYDPFAKGSI